MTDPTEADPFANDLGWWVSVYSVMRAAEGNPLSYQNAVAGVLAILLHVIQQADGEEVHRSAVKAVHRALDASLSVEVPAKESMN